LSYRFDLCLELLIFLIQRRFDVDLRLRLLVLLLGGRGLSWVLRRFLVLPLLILLLAPDFGFALLA
jgi:hypothetical protein